MEGETEAISLLKKVELHFGSEPIKNFFKDSVFIVSAPRSGSTLLFETLKHGSDFWSIGEESHKIFSAFPHLEAENADFDSGQLTEAHADDETCRLMRAAFLYFLQDREGRRYIDLLPAERPGKFYFLEKTPRNALNFPFLLKVFSDARFIFLHRDAKQNIGSIIDAWRMGEERGVFVTYRDLPGWDRKIWCLLLPPGWRGLKGKTIPEIAAFQWRSANQVIMNELGKLPKDRWIVVNYDGLVASPKDEVESLCSFTGARFDDQLKQLVSNKLPLSKTTALPPHPDKWKRHEMDILATLPSCQDVIDRLMHLDGLRYKGGFNR